MNNSWIGTTFKYDLNKILSDIGPSSIKSSPKGNNYTLDFSKELIKNEDLGTDHHVTS